MEWYEAVIGLLAAVGGVGGLIQLLRAIRSWREGVQQREAAPTERLVAHLEGQIADLKARIAALEQARNEDGSYIGQLAFALASQGLPVPPRSPKEV